MPRKKKLTVRVDQEQGVAYVTTTDVRMNFHAIYDRVLAKYDTVVVEKNNRPVAVLKRPEDLNTRVVEEEL